MATRTDAISSHDPHGGVLDASVLPERPTPLCLQTEHRSSETLRLRRIGPAVRSNPKCPEPVELAESRAKTLATGTGRTARSLDPHRRGYKPVSDSSRSAKSALQQLRPPQASEAPGPSTRPHRHAGDRHAYRRHPSSLTSPASPRTECDRRDYSPGDPGQLLDLVHPCFRSRMDRKALSA